MRSNQSPAPAPRTTPQMGFEWFVDVSAVFSQPIAVPKDVSYFYFLKKLATFELPPEPARKRARAAGLITEGGAG